MKKKLLLRIAVTVIAVMLVSALIYAFTPSKSSISSDDEISQTITKGEKSDALALKCGAEKSDKKCDAGKDTTKVEKKKETKCGEAKTEKSEKCGEGKCGDGKEKKAEEKKEEKK